MKSKFFFAILLCAAAISANAQTGKGKTLVGGSFSFSNTRGDQGTMSERSRSYSVGGLFLSSSSLLFGLKL